MRRVATARPLLAATAVLASALVVGAGLGHARPAVGPAGPADALPPYLYGPNLIRARAIVKADGVLHDYRVDRGRVWALRPGSVTLKERDSTTVTVPVAPTSRFQVNGRAAGFSAIKMGMSAVVVRDGEEPAELVHASSRTVQTRWLESTYFGPPMVRLLAVVKANGVVREYRLDRGRIRAIAPGLLTLRARDGLFVPIAVSSGARVKVNGRVAAFAALRRGMEATVVRDGDQPADTVLAFTRR